jgi:hypothetical protein
MVSPTKNHHGKTRRLVEWETISGENLEKDSPYVYLCSLGMQEAPKQAQRTLKSMVDLRLRFPLWLMIDSTTNSCSFCWGTVNGDVRSGS